MKRVYWAFVGVFIFTINARAVNVSSVWENVTGNWGVAANWTNFPNTVNFPNNGNGGFTYDATVGGGQATLNQAISIQKLNFNGGFIVASNNLTENDVFRWTAGEYQGFGTNFAAAGLVVDGAVTLSQSTFVPSLSTALTNGSLNMYTGATISNGVGVFFNFQDDSSVDQTSGYFINLGAVQKLGAGNGVSGAGVSNSYFGASLTNLNVVLVNTGTLTFWGGYSSGSLTTAPSGCIVLGESANYLLNGGTLSGGGTVEFGDGSSSTVTLSNTPVATVATLEHSGGYLTGGNLVCNGLFLWTLGEEEGLGTNFLNGPLVVDGAVTLSQRTLIPRVSTVLTNGGINMYTGATISNGVGVFFNFEDDSSVDQTSGYFINLGVVQKLGAGNGVSGAGVSNSYFGASVTNLNVIFVNAGTLTFWGGYSSGVLTTAPSGCIVLGESANYLLNGGTLSGGGTVEFGDNSSSTVTLSNTVTANVATVVHSGGTITGTGNLICDGSFHWTIGVESGTGTNFMNGPLLISANGWVLNQRTLVTTASSTLTNGYLLVNNGAAISNTASGVFDIPDDSSLLNNAGVGAFLNAGVLEKTGEGNNSSGQGASNSVVSIVLTNSGTVVAQSGTLKFTGGYFQTGGATEVNGGTLSSTTPLNILGGSVIGNGTILGTVLNNGVISPGVSGAGSLSLGGPLTNQAGATMLFQLGGYTPGVSCDFLSVSNRALLAGNLAVQFINNYSFISTVTNGASFTVANCPSNFAGAFANVANGGVLTSADDFATFTVTYSGSNIVLSSLNILYSVGDGIPNWWRTEFFGSPNTTNQFSCASCDPDGSGFSNLQAYQAGMNPLVPSTAFRILAIQPVGNDVHVTWNTAGGHTNMLQVVTGEVGGSFTNTFEDLPPQIIVTGSGDTMTNQLDVGGATNTPARYYRVRLVQ